MSDASKDTLPASGHIGRVIGKFRLERRLGSGAMGDVFLGVHIALGNLVAIKILNATATAESTGVERFLNEARAVAAIGHENIASVIDQDHLSDGTPYIVMEFVDGTTLRDLLVERRALPLRLAAELAIDTLAALSAAHGKGIVHRDLKPENIRVTPSGRAKVLDFGVAKLLRSPTTQLSTDGAIIGTPHYMAPEQVAAAPIDGRADLYAVGVLLFECTTGRRPFEGRTLIELLQQQVHAAPPWPHQLRHDLSPALEGVILKALEKDPARRFQSADEMAAALRAMLPTLTTSEAPAMEAGEGDVTATPGAGVYTPTRKELPVATPGLEAKTERTGSGGRGGQLVAVFVVVLGLTVAAVVAVQTQRQGVIELVPMGGSRRVTPGSALGTGGERGSIAGSGGVVGANGGVNGVGANVGGPGNRALMGSGGANAAGANAVGAVGGSAGSGGVIAANGGENGAGANAAGTGGGANAGSGEASGGVNGAGASATGATGGSDSNVASGGAVGAGAVGERVGSGGVVAANGGETGAGAHGAAAAAGKAGSGGMVAANGAGAKVEGVAVTGAASKAGNATRVGAGAGPTVSAVGGAGAARAPGSSGGTGKKNGPTASEPHPAIASAGKATPEASGDAVKPSTGGGVVIINTKAQLENLPADYDPKHFDVFGYAARARALAAERMSDAILINVDADGVAADGHADLTLSRDYEARYWFRSPSRSVVNPALPARDQDIVCKVYITATAKGIERHLASSSDGCTEKPLPKWRCTLPQAMQKGASLGARTDRVGKVAFLTDGTWLIDQGDGPNETIYFSCP